MDLVNEVIDNDTYAGRLLRYGLILHKVAGIEKQDHVLMPPHLTDLLRCEAYT